jgi:hypothetical protein
MCGRFVYQNKSTGNTATLRYYNHVRHMRFTKATLRAYFLICVMIYIIYYVRRGFYYGYEITL